MSTQHTPVSRNHQDVVGFRRIFILFCALVVLPSILLSGFGIVAIRNEGQAEKERQRERSRIILKHMTEDFVSLLSDAIKRSKSLDIHLNEAQQSPVQQLQPSDPAMGPFFASLDTFRQPHLLNGYAAQMDIETTVLNELQAIAKALPPNAVHYTALQSAPEKGLATVVKRDNGAFVTFFLNEKKLENKLGARLQNDPDIRFQLVGPAELEDLKINRPMKQIVQDLLPGNSESLLPEDELVSQRFPSPFDAYRMNMISMKRSSGMTILYAILLMLFNVALIVGVILTSRLIWKETRLSLLKTDFVSHVSHELRTPLTSIRMFIETLKLGRATSPQEQEECLELLSQETERLSHMIERVLGYARLKSGRRIFNFTQTHVDDLCHDALQAFRAHTLTYPEEQLHVTCDVESDLPPIHIDREAMGEVLLNLLGNAYKFSGTDKKIHLFAHRNRKKIIIGVQDNGPGVPRTELKRIFDRFYQGESLLSKPTQGSGLGLAITKSIVEGHRGKIVAENSPEGGSIFTIILRAD